MRQTIAFLLVFLFNSASFSSLVASDNPYFPLVEGLYSPYTQWSGGVDVYYNVVGIEEFYGENVWVVLRGDTHGLSSSFYEFYSIAADGDVLHHGRRSTTTNGQVSDQVLEPPRRILEMPIVADQTWSDTIAIHRYLDGVLEETVGGYSYSGHIVAIDSPVSVPAGNYSALEVTGEWSGGATDRYWFAEDEGLLRFEGGTGLTLSLWGAVLSNESQTWGSLKALFR